MYFEIRISSVKGASR